MNVREKNLGTDRLALSKPDQRRLERLAALAGRSPQAMLKFVLRDGFADCEETVRENQAAGQEFARGHGVGHADVVRSAKLLLAAHAKQTRKSG